MNLGRVLSKAGQPALESGELVLHIELLRLSCLSWGLNLWQRLVVRDDDPAGFQCLSSLQVARAELFLDRVELLLACAFAARPVVVVVLVCAGLCA